MERDKKKAELSLGRVQKELYRTLRSNIEFTGVDNRTIAITSCRPDDGKSTVTYHLSTMFAEEGKRCIIVDADMRKSVMVQLLGIKGVKRGLSEYLAGLASLDQVVYDVGVPELSLIPCGVFPSNPTELLANIRFAELLDELKQEYDYILIDTPPLGQVIDAAVIAGKTDGSLLVLPADTYTKSEVLAVTDQLKLANKNILGVVLNRFDLKKHGFLNRSYYGRYDSKYYG